MRAVATVLLPALLLAAVPRPAAAQQTSDCVAATYAALAREQRMFRAVVYGEYAPADQRVGAVLFDGDGNAWRKTDADTWKTLAQGYEGTTWTDRGMLGNWERDFACTDPDPEFARTCVQLPRRGIYATRKERTSGLMPPLLQAVRAFQCRLDAICKGAGLSAEGAGDRIAVRLPGCREMHVPNIRACAAVGDRTDMTFDGCETAVVSIMRHELSALELTVAHDSYRSYIQLAGMFDDFSDKFAKLILKPLFAAVKAMKGFDKIPCFLSQCDQ